MSNLLKLIFLLAIGSFQLFFTVSTLNPTTTSSVLRPTLKVPEVTFKANVTKPVSSVPFLITCHIENFDREGEHNYTVNYYKTAVAGNRTLIGRHEVTAYDSKNRPLHLFINVPQQNAEVHQGPRYEYPVFDAVVSVADVSYLEDYWCELNITSTQVVPSARKATSTPWPGFPLVSLSIVDAENAPNTYLARCTVSVFSNAERRPYTVQLLVSNIVMGTFKQSKPTEEVEFTLSAPYYEHLKVIGHGSNVSWPVFEFIFHSKEAQSHYFSCKMWITDAKDNEIVSGVFASSSIEHV